MRTYDKGTSPLRYAQPSTKCLVLGCLALAAGLIFLLGYRGLAPAVDVPLLGAVVQLVGCASAVCLSVSVAAFVAAVSVYFLLPDSARIRNRVRRGLFYPGCGNPLGLKDGELLPSVRCTCKSPGVFELTVIVRGCPVERVANAAPSISTALNGRFTRYAVTQTNAGIAFDKVVFQIENVMADKSLTFHAVEEMRPKPTKLRVQQDVDIDLTTSGSMLVAGKTRSGKTTGIISLLIQVLLGGRDKYGSEVIIIDPKQAELSRLPHVVTLDEDGEATQILEAMEHFAATITQRQKVLNELSAEDGDAAKWWDANFHCSLLFLDEYVACRSVFPTKASKDNPSYSLERFDRLFKRIVTMGASA
ncbi:MAG: FtsK/SpoIIIE domain-containing protein, partial [Elusimicrobiales bacterium]|nr:FtsK/SpoIIIE domain-containing protein [Elusimicrobiales bacterium]